MATHSNGTILKKSGTSLGEILKISGPSQKRSKKETSHLNMTDWCRSYKAGLLDPGDITFTLQTDSTHFGNLNSYLHSTDGGQDTYSITLPDASVFTGPAFVMDLGQEVDLDGIITVPVTLACTGLWTYS